jgi:hypothetical protein
MCRGGEGVDVSKQNLATIRAGYREVRRVIKHGPSYPWRRYFAPDKILNMHRIETDEAADLTVCVLTSRGDWLMCLWALVSFYKFSGLRLPLLIYGDGTLNSDHTEHIRRIFPNARIVEPANVEVSDRLSKFPNCLRFRSAQPCARRIIDFPILCNSLSILMLDSDILFFSRPAELVSHLELPRSGSFIFERDMQDAYFDSTASIKEKFNVEIASQVNCGIMLADISNFDFAQIEHWLGQAPIEKHPWAEQTLWAMYAGRGRTTLLGKNYDVTMSEQIGSSTVMKHYIKPIRDFMYTQGIPQLIRRLELRPDSQR